MRYRASSVALTALLLTGICAGPALAGEEPVAYRLTGAALSQEGEAAVRYTFSYPEGGALPGEEKMEYPAGDGDDYVYAYTYDEAGRLIQRCGHAAANTAGDVFMSRYAYDEQGLLTSESSSHTWADGSVSTYDALYIYDGEGRISQRLSGDNGEMSYVTEYTYDEAGHMTGTRMCSALTVDYDGEGIPVVTEMSEPLNETSYTYDSQDRLAGTEVRMDGKLAEQTAYTYDEAPLLTLQRCSQQDYDEQGQALPETIRFFVAQLKDAAGQTVLRFDMQGQPELTFDSAGYLIKAEAAGRTLEFTYEPVA